MKKHFGTMVLVLMHVFSYAQMKYAIDAIPAELKTRAGAVIRNDETIVEVKDFDEVIIRNSKAITVLNESADEEAALYLWYDKTRSIKFIKGAFYNESGHLISKITDKDFKDESAVSNISLFEDSRIKHFSPVSKTYPYTIEYESEIRVKQSLVLPEWIPCNSAGVSVQSSKFTILTNPDFAIRYKEMNKPGKVESGTDKSGYKTYKWEIKNMKALRSEPYSPDPEHFLPRVKLAPVNFAYQNVKGTFTNWNEYGKWTNEALLKDRDIIPEETKKYIIDLVKGIENPKLKAKKIYEFVQQKTRYISIQVGIGGFQPFPASDVDRLGYGDCKGLVNYMKGLLNTIGIKSYYTLVEAGNLKKSAIPEFASINQFNHAILCIPFPNDTTWVDCTSKTLPFGFLGDFTDDRVALACTEEGGKLIRTPKLTTEENKQIRKAEFLIDDKGGLNANLKTTFEGSQYENRETLINESYTEQIKKLKEIYNLDFNIESFKLNQDKGYQPLTTEEIKFTYSNYSSLSGERLFIPLNIIDPIGRAPKEVTNRTNPVYINRGYTDTDEIVFTLPKGYKLDTKPQNIIIEKPFGKFSSTIEINNNIAKYNRYVQLKEGLYPPEQYPELVKFYQSIADSDASRITLLK
jgi:hypothetical protein